jgi:prepilin-type processing-associated H-X9-DG protein
VVELPLQRRGARLGEEAHRSDLGESLKSPPPVGGLVGHDGKRRYPAGTTLNWLGIPPTREFNGNRSTLADYRRASLDPAYDYLGREALDYLRHNWRANVLFVDGHVESIVLSEEGCRAVGLCNGIYD